MRREPLQGQLYQQILALTDDNGAVADDTSSFVVMLLREEPVTDAYPDWYATPDRCWRSWPPPLLSGERDVGDRVPLDIGEDSIELRRSKSFDPGQILYLHNPADDGLDLGHEVGAELILDGTGTGVEVPDGLEWDPASWTELVETGVLDARWTPGDERTFVRLDLYLYDRAYNREILTCALRDDGHAVIDAGWAVEDLQGIELRFRRERSCTIAHPELGPLLVTSFRNIRLGIDHLLE